jgi:hypothetical protein
MPWYPWLGVSLDGTPLLNFSKFAIVAVAADIVAGMVMGKCPG